MRLFAKALMYAIVACLCTLTCAGTASAASAPAPLIGSVNVDFGNSGEDSGNDSALEIDRSLNLAEGNGSPGSDIINEVTGAGNGNGTGTVTGKGVGSGDTVATAPNEVDDE
ncbi:hypothetical protein [Spirillospora sp. NBC_01491]|uniref:hypothetical protein n=1 Tax=Spirillospora sp. NBC_01491 TaxID=2976007 RepID=UPI002E36411B|nr:hypothetical protein [Spirillospora sp. NBC_01491]